MMAAMCCITTRSNGRTCVSRPVRGTGRAAQRADERDRWLAGGSQGRKDSVSAKRTVLSVAIGLSIGAAIASHARAEESVEEEYDRWTRMFAGSGSYAFVTQVLCECGPSATPVIVSVSGGKVTGVRFASNGESVPPSVRRTFDYSIDDLFRRVREAKARGSTVTVRWHPVYGYPMYLHIDPSEEWLDDEVTIETFVLVGQPVG